MHRKIKPYMWIYGTGRLCFVPRVLPSRARRPRIRAQKMFVRYGGKPHLPLRVAFYPTPRFYYTGLMNLRRKADLDDGWCKVRYGIGRIQYANWLRDNPGMF